MTDIRYDRQRAYAVLDVWKSDTYRPVMLPAAGIFTCGQMADALPDGLKWNISRHGNIYTLISPDGDTATVDAANIDAVLELFLSTFLTSDTAPDGWEE